MKSFISPEQRASLIDYFHPRTKQGVIRTAFAIVSCIIMLSVLGFDIRAAIEHPQTQANFSFLGQFIADGWNNHVASYWSVIWNIVGPVVETVWGGAESFDWENLQEGGEEFFENIPEVPTIQ